MSADVYTKYVRNEKVSSAMLDGHAVLFSVEVGSYFQLNQVGSCIWEFLDAPKAIQEIFDHLSQNFDVNQDMLIKDVLPFLRSLELSRVIKKIEV